MKKIILIIIIAAILITSTSIFIQKNSKEFGYTKAICNEDNNCEDFFIECKNKKIQKITPTGFSIQQNKKWIDEREIEKKYC
jgi:hypothetical protein